MANVLQRGSNSAVFSAIAQGQPAAQVLAIGNFGLEVVDLPVYDDVSFAADTAVVTTTLFQTPVGQSGKTFADTSLVQAGQLEGGQAFRIRGLYVSVLPSVAPADLIAFSQNVHFELVISSGRKYWQSPAIMLPGGSVPYVTATATTATTTTIQTTCNGLPSVGNVRPLQYPVTIGDGEHFQVNMVVDTAFSTIATSATPVGGTGIKFWFGMYGDLFRFIR